MKAFGRLGVAVLTLGWTLCCLLAGAVLAPWWWSGATPVELVLHAPVETELSVRWSDEETPLKLIPVGEIVDGWAWFWTTELPPRPRYALSVEWGTRTEAVTFAELRVWQMTPSKRLRASALAAEPESWSATGLRVGETSADRLTFEAGTGGVLRLTDPVTMGTAWSSGAFWGAVGTLWIFGILVLGLLGSGWWFPAQLKPPLTGQSWNPRQWAIVLLAFVVSAAAHWHLATSSLPSFWPADSTSYADKGLALGYEGTFDTGQHEYELNRTPGYPLLMALGFRLFDPSLNAVVTVQTLLALFAWGFLFLSLRRLLPWWLLAAVIPFVLLSPALVWASRQIATESVFVSFWALGVGAFLFAWQSSGWRFVLAWTAFAVFAAYATFIRMNGILLLVLPGCALVGGLVRGWREGRYVLPPVRWWGRIVVPFVLVLVVLVVWSARNASNRGYARPTDLAPIVAANAPFNAGMFDVRSLPPEEAEAVLRARYSVGYFYPGWSLRHTRFRALSKDWTVLDNTSVGALADSLREFVEANNALIPWQGRLVAWWRVLGWGLWTPERGPFTQDALLRPYHVPATFGPDETWLENTLQQRFEWLHRKRAGGVQYPLLSIRPGEPSFLKDAYNRLVPAYFWVYRGLVFAGIGALLLAVCRRHYLPVILLAPVFVNTLLNVYFLYVVGRYVHVFDGFLLLGVAAVLWGEKVLKS